MNILPIEREITKMVNMKYGLKLKANDLMEWSTAPVIAQSGEALYEAGGYYTAFKVAV